MLSVRLDVTPAVRAASALLLCGLFVHLQGEPLFGQPAMRGVPAGHGRDGQPSGALGGGIPHHAPHHDLPAPQPLHEQPPQQLVVGVEIVGNETTPEVKIQSFLRTRRDREFDPETVQADVRRLAASGLFRDVRTYTQPTPGGVLVIFEVFERPTIRHIKFVGNRGLSDKALLKQSGLQVGDALNYYSVEEARRKTEEFYHGKGFPKTQVSILEGNQPGDRGVVLLISEGSLQRISSVSFVGNTIATDARLKTQIQSKPGILWYFFRGKVDRRKIDEDLDRLTAYYRSLGFFRARVGRELEFSNDGKWLTLTFVIDEGPRYVVRNVSISGNEKFATEPMLEQLELKSGEFFNLAKMNKDVNTLRDLYGGEGHIFADIQAAPRFLEEPGELDLVYNIQEGDLFRVGRINIHIAGEFPHTRQNVVLNRLSLRPGDIIDIREVRDSERRLKASQLFRNEPASGVTPRIVIRPPELQEDVGMMAGRQRPGPPSGAHHGQSGDDRR